MITFLPCYSREIDDLNVKRLIFIFKDSFGILNIKAKQLNHRRFSGLQFFMVKSKLPSKTAKSPSRSPG